MMLKIAWDCIITRIDWALFSKSYSYLTLIDDATPYKRCKSAIKDATGSLASNCCCWEGSLNSGLLSALCLPIKPLITSQSVSWSWECWPNLTKASHFNSKSGNCAVCNQHFISARFCMFWRSCQANQIRYLTNNLMLDEISFHQNKYVAIEAGFPLFDEIY